MTHPQLGKNVSAKIHNMHTSGTLAIAEKAFEMREKGIDVLSFSVGEPDFTTPQNVIDAAKRALDAGKTHYTPVNGIPELRQAIAHKSLVENGIPCTERDVMVTVAKHGIFSTIFSWVDRKEEVIVPEPAWVSYTPAIKLVGGIPIVVDMAVDNPTHKIYFNAEGQGDVVESYGAEFRLSPDMINEKITPKTKMIILNSPSNPTGMVIPKKDLKGIADLAKDYDLLVLSDEIYEKLIYDDAEHVSISSFDDMFERTITLNGLSKTYAMTGWRIGWLVAPPKILKEIAKVQQHTITCANSIAQWAAVEALTGPRDEVQRMLQTFEERRNILVKGLNRIEGIHCSMPKGAFYVFFKYGFDMSSQEFSEYLIENAHIAVTPGSAFGEAGEGYVRMSYATSRKNIARGLANLEAALKTLGEKGIPMSNDNRERKNGNLINHFMKVASKPVRQLGGMLGADRGSSNGKNGNGGRKK